MTTIWHNPRCSKSRATLALLTEAGITPQIRLYLQDPPSVAELQEALTALGQPALSLLRVKDAPKDLATAPEAEILAALAANPALIERPLVLHENRAALGRPPEAVLTLFP
ncbi:arsenate reductase (glutaredoxin) [Phaeovulum sp. W22_SRMD_FR3]|uniref:arsenate reductase (glutaredoxin) n=1 Tax=Phaeovulum sp. W22_SRMD_FR3 TaxID=3240274 RepID=UPI003F9E11E7